MAKVLVADDEHAICEAFRQLLARDGHEPLIASTGGEAIAAARDKEPDAVFMDVQLPDMSGLEALQRIRQQTPDLPVIIMTAHGTVQTALQAMQHGAFDYLGKPLDLPEIRAQLERALHPGNSAGSAAATPRGEGEPNALIGTSRAMQEIFKMIGLLTANDLTVLITGESGVGKDLVAKNIHFNGARRNQPFVAINCAAIPEQLVESELFGHDRGAFTGAHSSREGRFEAAGAGTLFLDELSELPYHLQAKLLRVLQERTFERVGSSRVIPLQARILAASNRPLDSTAGNGSFRQDLYYRLSLINLQIPPLREHLDDLPLLANHFLAQANQSLSRNVAAIEPAAMERLLAHHWPGNVRELEHTIKRSVLTARGDTLVAQDLQFDDSVPPITPAAPTDLLAEAARVALRTRLRSDTNDRAQHYKALVNTVERALIDEALRHCEGNQVAASQLLGINRTTLRSKQQG